MTSNPTRSDEVNDEKKSKHKRDLLTSMPDTRAMMMHSAPFPCDPQLWQRFLATCQSRDETPGAVLRDLVRLEVQRQARRHMRRDAAIDEPLLAHLRLIVAQALVGAQSWGQMQAALARHGLGYIAAGGGLNLIDSATAEVLCKGSQVGPAYLDLVRRFGCGFPGHPRPAIAAQALGQMLTNG